MRSVFYNKIYYLNWVPMRHIMAYVSVSHLLQPLYSLFDVLQVIVISQDEYDTYLCYYTGQRQSQGRVLITKISYEGSCFIICLHPKEPSQSVLSLWNNRQFTVHTSYNLNMTCVHVHMQRPRKIHTHDFVIYMQLHVRWITFMYRPTCVSINYRRSEKFWCKKFILQQS